eukprot:5584796-Amphidinium_carterae.1
MVNGLEDIEHVLSVGLLSTCDEEAVEKYQTEFDVVIVGPEAGLSYVVEKLKYICSLIVLQGGLKLRAHVIRSLMALLPLQNAHGSYRASLLHVLSRAYAITEINRSLLLAVNAGCCHAQKKKG